MIMMVTVTLRGYGRYSAIISEIVSNGSCSFG